MTSEATTDRRRIPAYLPQPLFERLLKVGGETRAHGFFNDTIIAALEDYLPKFEKPRIQDPQKTWIEQLIEDTTRKKRGKR